MTDIKIPDDMKPHDLSQTVPSDYDGGRVLLVDGEFSTGGSWVNPNLWCVVLAYPRKRAHDDMVLRFSTLEAAENLIDAIIRVYNTTRLSDMPASKHILSKSMVQHAFSEYLKSADSAYLTALTSEPAQDDAAQSANPSVVYDMPNDEIVGPKTRAKIAERDARIADLEHDVTRQMAIANEHVNRCAQLEADNARLREASTSLYLAGKWSCDQPVDEAALWEALRDAIGLAMGTETARQALAKHSEGQP